MQPDLLRGALNMWGGESCPFFISIPPFKMSSTSTSSAHTPAPWRVTTPAGELIIESVRNGNPCTIALGLFDEYNEPTKKELRANARLLAAAPELLSLAETFKNACEERISILEEERDAEYPEDTDDQIDHWSALRNQCISLISKVA